MIDPESSKFIQERELILDHIDLVNEINSFIVEETDNKELAEDYILKNPIDEYKETKMQLVGHQKFVEKQKDGNTLNQPLVQQWKSRV